MCRSDCACVVGCGIDIDSDALAAAQRNAAAALGEASVAAVPGEAPAAAVPPRVAFLRADFSGLATGEVRRRLHPNGCAASRPVQRLNPLPISAEMRSGARTKSVVIVCTTKERLGWGAAPWQVPCHRQQPAVPLISRRRGCAGPALRSGTNATPLRSIVRSMAPVMSGKQRQAALLRKMSTHFAAGTQGGTLRKATGPSWLGPLGWRHTRQFAGRSPLRRRCCSRPGAGCCCSSLGAREVRADGS